MAISEREGVPLAQMRLVFAGKTLDEPYRELLELGVQHESTLHWGLDPSASPRFEFVRDCMVDC